MNKIFLSFILLVSLQTANVWGATITRYVNPGSAGGDGTTSALSGANAAYASLSAWEAAEQQDLTDAGGDIMVVNCAGTTADTTAVTILGWTTGSTTYISIIGDNTSGKWDTGKYRLEITGAHAIDCDEDYVRIEGLQISVGSSYQGYRVNWNSLGAAEHQISHNIIKGAGATSTGTGIYLDEFMIGKVWNNIVYDFAGAGGIGIGAYNGPFRIYNNTVVDSTTGINVSAGVATTLKNNLVNGSGTNYSITSSTTSNNLSEDATSPDVSYRSKAVTFIDEVNDNFHIGNADTNAKDAGTDLSGDANLAFSDDVDSVTRTGTWDIGADELVVATITRYVNPGSAGGNGTTSALSGANAAYASLSAWEAAEQQDLTDAGGDIMVVNCAGTVADTTRVDIDGWTTGSTNYIQIQTLTADRHDGKWNAGKYMLQNILVNLEDYVRIDGLQIGFAMTSNYSGISVSATNGSSDVRISNSIIRATSISGTYIRGIRLNTGTVKVWNNIVYDFAGNNTYQGIATGGSTVTGYLYNNTVFNCYDGIRNDNSSVDTLYIVNNIVQQSTGGYFSTGNSWGTGSDYNISNVANDLPAGQTNSKNSTTVSFVDSVNADFHLASGDTGAKDAGTSDPGTGLFSDDIDGVARSGTWDIGADEYVAAGGTFTPIISLY